MNKQLEFYMQAAREASTLGLRSYYLGVIESITGTDCPFTGYAFMVREPAALTWLNA